MKKLQHFFSSRKSWVLPYLIFSVIFVIIPLLLIVVYAFTDDMGHLTLANFSKFFAHSESVNTFVYSIGIAILTTLGCILLGYPGSLDSEQQQESELFAYADHVVYPSDVGKHSGTYTCHGSVVRFLQAAVGRGSFDFRYDIQFYSLYDLSHLQYLAEDGQKLH